MMEFTTSLESLSSSGSSKASLSPAQPSPMEMGSPQVSPVPSPTSGQVVNQLSPMPSPTSGQMFNQPSPVPSPFSGQKLTQISPVPSPTGVQRHSPVPAYSPGSGPARSPGPTRSPGPVRNQLGTGKKDASGEITTPLPPCRICGDRASGFHYGANTCEACKGFFRRCIMMKKVDFTCPGSETCRLTPTNKAACPACRYRRCLEAGMSRDGSKPGRYTLERKSDYIKEVKQLQEDMEARRLGVANAERRVYLDSLLEMLSEANEECLLHTPGMLSTIPEKQNRYKEIQAIKEEFFGPMKPLSTEEFEQVYASTGIDVDGRVEVAAKSLFPMAHEAVRKLIKFTRYLPGFSNFHSDDQIALIKGCFFEWVVLSALKAINVQDNLMTNQEGETVSKTDMALSCGISFIDEFYRVAGILQRLKLTPIETSLVKGLCILSPDRCELVDRARVESCQSELTEALQYHVTKTRQDGTRSVARILGAITEMRTPAHLHAKVKEKLKDTLETKMPPLIIEMCTK